MSFFFKFLLFIFLTRTITGQWWPQPHHPLHMHAGTPTCLPPHHPQGMQAPAITETMTILTLSPQHPPPALIIGLTPPNCHYLDCCTPNSCSQTHTHPKTFR